jgi:3-methyladenine DNA glycosylase/8-oxoguanine DNA glycosylase
MALRLQVARMLSLNEDLKQFYQMCEPDQLLGFVQRYRCGRLLRSPTAFEDLVKTVCTTNCDWKNTIKMCLSLCGISAGAFPTPHDLLKFSPIRLARKVPIGYRARTILEIARLTADEQLPLDEWATQGQYDLIRGALTAIWGIGPYALNHMMVLLGDYSSIPVDCEVLRYLREVHFGGEDVAPEEAVGPYEHYGSYKFLAFKFGRMARKFDYAKVAHNGDTLKILLR